MSSREPITSCPNVPQWMFDDCPFPVLSVDCQVRTTCHNGKRRTGPVMILYGSTPHRVEYVYLGNDRWERLDERPAFTVPVVRVPVRTAVRLTKADRAAMRPRKKVNLGSSLRKKRS